MGKKQNLPYDNVGLYLDQVLKECAHKTALADENTSITFKELEQKIENLLLLFKELELANNARVIVLMEPTCEQTIAAYSIMRYGACYVPLDPDYPPERLKYILENASISLILTNLDQHPLLCNSTITVINTRKDQNKNEKKNIKFEYPQANSTAYIIYTSGSTGKPKGVEVSHISIVNHMLWMKKNFNLSEKDNFLFRTSTMFDASIWELLIPIFTGGKQAIPNKNTKLDLELLQKFIKNHKVTIAQFVPTFFREFLKRINEKNCPTLKHIFLGGESIESDIKKHFFIKFHRCKLTNLYGPTEATIDSSSYTFNKKTFDLEHNIIGTPIFNATLYILDNNLKVIKTNEEGELYIGGLGLAKGYLNNFSLTQKNFINTDYGYLYKTGDLVKQKKNLLIYLGRIDEQIKINGIRIDPQEIISVLIEKFPKIKNCLIFKNNQPKILSNSLACFIEAEQDNGLNTETVKKFLESFYPKPLIPKHICILKNFPHLPNGKIDKNKLLTYLNRERNKYIKQRDGNDIFEQKLSHIWVQTLDTSIDHNFGFFDNGGDSIAAIQLVEQINKEFNVYLTISDIIKNPTISKQANLIKLKKALSIQGATVHPNNPIICLNIFHKNKPSIFLVHPIGGTIFWYINIAKYLEGKFNIFGIQDPDIENIPHPPFLSIQDMSEYYGEKVLDLLHGQPFILGGASFGTNIAIDMGNYLLKKHKRAVCLISFDGWRIYPDSFHDFSIFKELMQKQYEKLLSEFIGTNYLKNINPLFEIQQKRLNFLNNYQPNIPDIPFYLFKSKEQTGIFQKISHETNFWGEHMSNIKTILTPGDHETMFSSNNSPILAKKISEELKPLLKKPRKTHYNFHKP